MDTEREEFANWLTHGIAFLLSIAGTVALLYVAGVHGSIWHVLGFSVFGGSLIVLYFFSTLYHLTKDPKRKQRIRIFDHAAIFLLIAGTYTPLLLIYLRSSIGWPFLGVIWAFACAGILFKLLFKTKYRFISLSMYLAMGWLCVLAADSLLEYVPGKILALLAVGGVLYTIGVVFYSVRSMPYNHAVWHIFVIGGSMFHYVAILLSAYVHV